MQNITKLLFVKKALRYILFFLAVSTTSYAQDTLLSYAEKNGIYGSVEVGTANIIYPKSTFFVHRGEAAPFTRIKILETDDNRASGSLLSAKLGTYLPVSLVDGFRTKAELRIWRAKTQQTSNASFYDTGAGVRYGWVKYGNTGGVGTNNGTTLYTSINQDIEYSGQDFLFALEHKQKEGGMWILFAGPSFKRLEQKTFSKGTLPGRVGTLNERLSTKLMGAKVGAKYSRNLNDTWSVSLDVSASLYDSKTNYTGAYYDSASGDDVKRSLGATDTVHAIDTRLDVSYKITKGLDISAYALMNHLSSVPVVEYGSVSTDPDKGVLRLEAAKNYTMYAVGLKLSKAF